ncbi:hypothetical protein JCM11251_004013 [Rhodosporidiobolus azoricus]
MSAPPTRTAHLPNGVKLAYIDSYATISEADRPREYTTVIGLHGVGFNSAVWTPVLPHLPTSLRFLAYNQRSYTGSSPAFESQEEGGIDATAAYLADLMEFVKFAVDELGVETVEEGGIVLLGWSKGNVLSISLLSLLHLASIPSATSFASFLPNDGTLPHTSLLTTHLRSILLYEPAGSALGRPPTEDFMKAMAAVLPPNKVSSEEFATAFAGWIGDYCPPTSTSPEPVASLPPSGLAALSGDLLSSAWETSAVAHGFSWKLSASPAEVQQLANTALSPPLSPAVPIGLIYGGRSVGYCMDAAEEIMRWWSGGDGGKVRKTAVRKMEGTNHFGFLHEPEEFVKTVQETIQALSE